MNDWIHCNKCSLKYCSNIKLFLTECGHILCGRCLELLKEPKCIVCEKPTNIIEISKDMDFEVQQFFVPLETLLKKTLEVYKFQMAHRTRLLQAIKHKYEYAKKECITVHNKNKNLARENRMLKTILMSMGQNPHQQFTSTPALTSDNSQTDNMSVMSSIPFTPNMLPPSGRAQKIIPGGYVPVKPHNQHQFHMSRVGSSARPSPAQTVPNAERRLNMAPIHKPLGTGSSMQQLRVGKRT